MERKKVSGEIRHPGVEKRARLMGARYQVRAGLIRRVCGLPGGGDGRG